MAASDALRHGFDILGVPRYKNNSLGPADDLRECRAKTMGSASDEDGRTADGAVDHKGLAGSINLKDVPEGF
jgi:hypothetical protein